MQFSAMQLSAIQYNTVQFIAVQWSAIYCSSVRVRLSRLQYSLSGGIFLVSWLLLVTKLCKYKSLDLWQLDKRLCLVILNWTNELKHPGILKLCKCFHLQVFFKASALWADAFYKSKCPTVCPSVRLSVCLFTFEVPFNGLFAPSSRSRMSNIFRDSKSLGKSNGKKWSNIWTF